MTAAAAPKGWIFSPKKDATVFWAPLLVLLACAFLFDASNPQVDLIYYYLLLVPFQDGHLWGTYGTVLRRRAEGRMPRTLMVVGPVCAVSLFLLLYYRSHSLYFFILSVVGLTHILRQQYGWVMVSRRHAAEGDKGRLIDTAAVWNQMLPPVIWWLSPMSPAAKVFFGVESLPSFPASVAQAALVFHWVFNAFYIGREFYRYRRDPSAPINWGKYSLLASTWVWFYFGLVLQPNPVFFFRGIMTIHSMPYLLFTREKMGVTRWGPTLAFVAGFIIFAVLLESYSTWLDKIGILGGAYAWLGASFQIPLIVHYYFDSFIWLRPRNGLVFHAYGSRQPV